MTNQCATCGCQLDYPTATHIIDCSQPTPTLPPRTRCASNDGGTRVVWEGGEE